MVVSGRNERSGTEGEAAEEESEIVGESAVVPR